MDLMKEKNFVSLVAYLHNDSDRVTSFFQTMQKILQENFLKYEMIFVDDASEDDTVKKLRAAADGAKGGMIQIIRMSYFQGVEMAMNAGTDLSIGDFVFEFDSLTADYEPSLVMEVYRRSLEGYDIVSASPEGGQEENLLGSTGSTIISPPTNIPCGPNGSASSRGGLSTGSIR